MSFTNDPQRDIDRVRMTVGDTNPDNEYLEDSWYLYFLTNASGNERQASISAARSILTRFTANVREKVDQVEIYGNQTFDQYLKWLEMFLKDPNISGMRGLTPYAGGISKSDMLKNKNNPDVNGTPDFDFIGDFEQFRCFPEFYCKD